MENDDPELGVELQAKDLNAVLVTQPVNSPYWIWVFSCGSICK